MRLDRIRRNTWLVGLCVFVLQINTACSANGPRVERKSTNFEGEKKMKDMLLKTYIKAQILREDHGQDLIEYALVAALIAFAAVAGMGTVATGINTAFSKIASRLTSSIT
jgi:pilus assembly protein Flp/PilA